MRRTSWPRRSPGRRSGPSCPSRRASSTPWTRTRGTRVSLDNAEIYDPAADVWRPAGEKMACPRSEQAAVLLSAALDSVGLRPPVRRPYTAPERATGDPWDGRADVYSLTAIAHEVLTGRRPAGRQRRARRHSGDGEPARRRPRRQALRRRDRNVVREGAGPRPGQRRDPARRVRRDLTARRGDGSRR